MTEQFIGSAAFAARAQMGQSEVQRKAKAGLIPGAYLVGGRWKFDWAEYVEAVKGRPEPKVAAAAPITRRKRGSRR